MATEIEHKYLVVNDDYMQGYTSATYYRQGYLTTDKSCVVRVRIAGTKAYLTLKGINQGASRPEYELEISVEMAQSMLDTLCNTPIIEKTRYLYPCGGHMWEVDRFEGDNEGLVIAEIELLHENEVYECPSFIGRNVTHEARYYNACLTQHPFSQWSDAEKGL